MASFDFFTQPQGPVIPISLFGDAARGGTEVGNAIPTPVTAAIQGGIKGYQIGQQIEATNQENAIRANQIQQLPIQNEIQQQQLEQNKLKTTQEQLQTDLALATQNNRTTTENSVLEDQNAKAIQDKNTLDAAAQFNTAFKSATPQQQVQMVLGGQYSDVFAKNPNLYKQSLQSIYLNPNSTLDPQTKANIGAFFNKTQIQDAYTKAAQANLPNYIKAESDLLNDPLTGQVVQGTGLSAKQAYGNIKFSDNGQYQTGPDGKTILTDVTTGEPLQKPDFAGRLGTAPQTGYDAIYTDPQTGEKSIVASGLDKDQKKKFDVWSAQKAIQDGSSMRSDLAQVDRQTQAQKDKLNQQSITGTSTPGSVSTFQGPPAPSSTSNNAAVPMRVQIAARTLGLPTEDAIKLDPTLKSLEDHIVQERTNPDYRNSPAAALKKNTLFETIGRTYASDQIDNSPALQAQYNQGEVDRYNKSLQDETFNKLNNANPAAATAENVKTMIGPFLADNPKDYYYKRNLPAINQSLKYLNNQYVDIANKKIQASANKLTATQRIMQDLAGTANGR